MLSDGAESRLHAAPLAPVAVVVAELRSFVADRVLRRASDVLDGAIEQSADWAAALPFIWGVEPGQTSWCPDAAHRTKILYDRGASDAAYHVSPIISVQNTSDQMVPLSELTVRYWFTRDNASPMTLVCDGAIIGCDNVLRRMVSVSPARNGADTYIEVGFAGGAVLWPGWETGNVWLRAFHNDYATFTC